MCFSMASMKVIPLICWTMVLRQAVVSPWGGEVIWVKPAENGVVVLSK